MTPCVWCPSASSAWRAAWSSWLPDELLEVTPENLRIRKRILDHDLRMKAASKKNK